MKKTLILATLIFSIFTVSTYSQSRYIVGQINEVKTAFDKNDRNEGFRLSQYTNDDWVKIAISKAARAQFHKSYHTDKLTPFEQEAINKALDALALSATAAMDEYTANLSNFTFKNPANERLIKTKLDNISTLKIFRTGFSTAEWLIHANNLGIPRLRFKRGYILAKDSRDEHKYCHVYYVSVNQPYAGGGTYGGTYTTFENDTLVACPK